MKKLTPAAAQDAELPAKPGLGGQVLALRSSSIFPQASDLPSSTFEIWTLCLFVSGFSDGILKVYLLLKMSGTLAGDKKKKKENVRGKGQHVKPETVEEQEGIGSSNRSAALPCMLLTSSTTSAMSPENSELGFHGLRGNQRHTLPSSTQMLRREISKPAWSGQVKRGIKGRDSLHRYVFLFFNTSFIYF